MPIDIAALYEKYGPMVLRRCRSILGDEQDSLDAVHDVFVSLLRVEKRLNDRFPSSLLYTIATNVCLNRLRKKKGEKRRILIPLFLLLVVACCGAVYYFRIVTNYYTTDNAKVTAQMYPVAALSSGKLLIWDVSIGDYVRQDQILGRQEILPYITAPNTGIVVKNDGAVNQMVAAGTPLAIIADIENLYIGVNVEETDIDKIRLGQYVEIQIDAYPKKAFSGRVYEINQTTQNFFSGMSSFSTSGTFTKVTQLIPIKVSIQNKDNVPLTFGMNASVKILLE